MFQSLFQCFTNMMSNSDNISEKTGEVKLVAQDHRGIKRKEAGFGSVQVIKKIWIWISLGYKKAKCTQILNRELMLYQR